MIDLNSFFILFIGLIVSIPITIIMYYIVKMEQ